ncbi:MAG: glycerophosphodiester phosphodiesterase [Chitinophagales bacterium]
MEIKVSLKFSLFFFLTTLLCLTGCKKSDRDPQKGDIKVIGHGGGGFETIFHPLPANTMESIEKAIREDDADGIEIDIQLSADDILVLFHDKTLDKKTDCTGTVRSYSFTELQGCNFHGDHKLSGGDHKIVSLEQVFTALADIAPSKYFYLNIKPDAEENSELYLDILSRKLANIIERHGLKNNTIIETPDMNLLMKIRERDSTLILMRDIGLFENDFKAIVEHDLDGIVVAKENITAEQVKEAQAAGKIVVIYGIRSAASIKKVLNMYPDVVQTDRVSRTKRLKGE